MEAEKKEKGKEYTCRKEITIFRTEIRKKKGSKKKVRKIQQKILQVQSKVKKNIGLSIRRGGDSGFLVYSNTPPTPNQWPLSPHRNNTHQQPSKRQRKCGHGPQMVR